MTCRVCDGVGFCWHWPNESEPHAYPAAWYSDSRYRGTDYDMPCPNPDCNARLARGGLVGKGGIPALMGEQGPEQFRP